jgi:hypothetical protein
MTPSRFSISDRIEVSRGVEKRTLNMTDRPDPAAILAAQQNFGKACAREGVVGNDPLGARGTGAPAAGNGASAG